MSELVSDAELSAWYGMGLHAPKVKRLIDEIRRLRRMIHNAQSERCTDEFCECCDLILVELLTEPPVSS